MILRRMMGPSLKTATVFDAALSGNYCVNCDSVSVIAVQEKCDEKGLGAASGHRNVRCRQFVRAPSRSTRRGAPRPWLLERTKFTRRPGSRHGYLISQSHQTILLSQR